MKPTLPTTNALRGRAPALMLVIRGLWLRLLVINLTSSLSQRVTLLCLSRDPLHLKMMIIWKGSQPSEDEGLYIPSFLEEALGGDGNLQKMAHTLQAQVRHDKKCFLSQSGDHLMKDHCFWFFRNYTFLAFLQKVLFSVL